jgi:hypothetical protein
LALTAFASLALATTPLAAAEPEAGIPFVSHGGIRDWKVADRTTLYIQARDRKWYKATVLSSCRDLNFATGIGFDAGSSGTFDRSAYILAEGQRCPVQSVVASPPPPKGVK